MVNLNILKIMSNTNLLKLGIGLSSIFGTLIGYLNNYFPVTGNVTSLFLVAACVGEFIWPLVVGKFIDTWPYVYLTTIALSTGMCCVLFALIMYLNRNYVQVKRTNIRGGHIHLTFVRSISKC